MRKQRKPEKKIERAGQAMDLSHLRRETRTALELAVAALAPTDLIDRLAWGAGLLEAIAELPPQSAPVLALVPKLKRATKRALAEWTDWQARSGARPT